MGKAFKHSGELGDIIFALPTIRALGGGTLFLNAMEGRGPREGLPAHNKPTGLTRAAVESLKPLLLHQPYIDEVREWAGEKVDFDLHIFRDHLGKHNIADSHLAAFGLPTSERDSAWLIVADPIKIDSRPIVISRSVRYHGNECFWDTCIDQLLAKGVFVGYPKDHEIFVYTFGRPVPYYPTPDILTLAGVIAGCEEFVSNQGFPHALAEGMKKTLTLEVFRVHPAVVFKRDGARYV
jgi:hypothetical protein